MVSYGFIWFYIGLLVIFWCFFLVIFGQALGLTFGYLLGNIVCYFSRFLVVVQADRFPKRPLGWFN